MNFGWSRVLRAALWLLVAGMPAVVVITLLESDKSMDPLIAIVPWNRVEDSAMCLRAVPDIRDNEMLLGDLRPRLVVLIGRGLRSFAQAWQENSSCPK